MSEPDESEENMRSHGGWWLLLGACVMLPAVMMPVILDEKLPGPTWLPLTVLPMLSMSGIVFAASRVIRSRVGGCWLAFAFTTLMLLIAAVSFFQGCASRFRL